MRLMLLALLALAATAAPASAAVRDCRLTVSETESITSVRNMTCRDARRDLRRYDGFVESRFETPGGFRCTRQSGFPVSGEWRCVKAKRAYRFEFGD